MTKINDAVDITLDDIRLARSVGSGTVEHTPVTPSAYLSERLGGKIVLKAENLQRTGAFKIRGALNKVARLGPAASNGVVAGSAGNHAQALALAARQFGVRCEIYVPRGASLSKVASCRSYGATVREGGDNVEAAVAMARSRAEEANMAFCHPFDDIDVIAGQGTLGLELLEDINDLAQVIVPLGGGGLLSGVAIALKLQMPSIRVIGVQISSCAPYIYGQMPAGPVLTLADGIAVKHPGKITEPLIRNWVDEIVEVDEDSVADAMMTLMERAKLYVEGAGAVGVSALLTARVTPAKTGTTCVVLSGGNVDLGLIPNLVRRHETIAGRRLIVFVRIADRPGGLARLLSIFADLGANLIEVQHVRDGLDLHVRETGVQVTLEIRGAEHADSLLEAAKADGYDVTAMNSR
ncbi:MAG: pyridoxal-phosphate dependent enzyme [Ilumatobacteraceae bacterium]